MAREESLRTAWRQWRINATSVRNRLVCAQVHTRVHPYLRGEAYIPSPQNRVQELVSGGAPIAEVLGGFREGTHLQIWFPRPFLHEDSRNAIMQWAVSNDHPPPALPRPTAPATPYPIAPSCIRCLKCNLPDVIHSTDNCPLWKKCTYCGTHGHHGSACGYPHTLCLNYTRCQVQSMHRAFKAHGGCKWHRHRGGYFSVQGNASHNGDYDYYEDYDWEA